MIVRGMSYEEIRKECIQDQEEIAPRAFKIIKSNKVIKKFIQERNKCCLLNKPESYSFKSFTLTSKNNNTVLILPNYSVSMKDFYLTIYVLYNFGSGIYAAHITRSSSDFDRKSIQIFTPHYLDRFRERSLKDITIGKFDVLREITKAFSGLGSDNKVTCIKFEGSNISKDLLEVLKSKYPGNHIIYPVKDKGISICEINRNIDYDIVVFKTFLSLDILKSDQKTDLDSMVNITEACNFLLDLCK